MSRPRWAALIALALSASPALARPRSRSQRPLDPPLRVVLTRDGVRQANCVFSTAELAEMAGGAAPVRNSFQAGEAVWGRCFFPERLGANKPGELIDTIFVDGKKTFEQAYQQPVPSDAASRSVPYSEVLRTLLATIGGGGHRVRIEGVLRRGSRALRLYSGEFGYVR